MILEFLLTWFGLYWLVITATSEQLGYIGLITYDKYNNLVAV